MIVWMFRILYEPLFSCQQACVYSQHKYHDDTECDACKSPTPHNIYTRKACWSGFSEYFTALIKKGSLTDDFQVGV